MGKIFLSLVMTRLVLGADAQSNQSFEELIYVPNNFIIKKGKKHKFDDMMHEAKQFPDLFDKYLK
jgi:hypothetical protein